MHRQIFSIDRSIVGRSVNEHCVITTRAFPPATNGMNMLAFHTTNTGEVAGGMEGGNGSGVNGS